MKPTGSDLDRQFQAIMSYRTKSHAEAVKLSHDAYLEAAAAAEEKRLASLSDIRAMREAGATNQEIGDVLGVTRQRVSQILRKDSK